MSDDSLLVMPEGAMLSILGMFILGCMRLPAAAVALMVVLDQVFIFNL
ncbi:hypothetical protein [Polynucleobacter sp. UB-Siik-W21]|nr:hypothetical protein [Polynucleobacter sp. UB-Siik-W21]QWD70685.1 hypothetical protein C2756_01520 [Polynucleobacter sp. UB-Siik-W21]